MRKALAAAVVAASLALGAWWWSARRATPTEPDPAPRSTEAPQTPPDALQREQRALESLGYSAGAEVELGEVGVTVHDAARATAGANLYCSGHGPEAVLMDNFGRELHRWRRSFAEAFPERAGEVSDARTMAFRRVLLLPSGGLLAIFEGRGVVALERDSRVRWTYGASAHHDVRTTPDGRIFVLIRVAHVVPELHSERPTLEDFVAVLDADGRELERVSVLECLQASAQLAADVREAGDILHTNSLELLDGRHAERSPIFAAGNVLVSIRNCDQLAVLDLAARRAVWSLRGSWRRQHEASLLADGHILLFNNRARQERSSVIELDPLSGEELWELHSSDTLVFASKTCGTARRLSSGNTLIVGSESARALEVTPAGELVWEFRNPHTAPDDPALAAMLYDLTRIEDRALLRWL